MVARQQLVVGLIPTQNLMVARQQLVVGSIPTQSFKNFQLLPVQPLPSTCRFRVQQVSSPYRRAKISLWTSAKFTVTTLRNI